MYAAWSPSYCCSGRPSRMLSKIPRVTASQIHAHFVIGCRFYRKVCERPRASRDKCVVCNHPFGAASALCKGIWLLTPCIFTALYLIGSSAFQWSMKRLVRRCTLWSSASGNHKTMYRWFPCLHPPGWKLTLTCPSVHYCVSTDGQEIFSLKSLAATPSVLISSPLTSAFDCLLLGHETNRKVERCIVFEIPVSCLILDSFGLTTIGPFLRFPTLRSNVRSQPTLPPFMLGYEQSPPTP